MFPRTFSLNRKHIALTFAALGAMLLWIFCWIMVGIVTDGGGSSLPQSLMPAGPVSPMPALAGGLLPFFYVLVQACVFAPIVEEVFWRWMFCSIAYDHAGKARGNWSFPLMIGSCGLLFGLSHGFRYGFTYEMIIRMSMIGAILGVLWVMLKRRGAGAVAALLCCVFAHGAYNFSMSALQAATSQAAVQGYKAGSEETFEKCKELVLNLIKEKPEQGQLMTPAPPLMFTPAPQSK